MHDFGYWYICTQFEFLVARIFTQALKRQVGFVHLAQVGKKWSVRGNLVHRQERKKYAFYMIYRPKILPTYSLCFRNAMIFPNFCIIKRLGTYLPFCGECQSIIIKFTAFWRVSLWLVGNRHFYSFLSRNTTQRFSKGYNMRRYAVPIEQTNWLPGLHPHRLSWEVKHSKTIRSNLKFRVGFFFFFFQL